MTIPIWTPFAVLSVVCVFCPPPEWVRRIGWTRLVGWWACLSFCFLVWYAVFRLVWWVAS